MVLDGLEEAVRCAVPRRCRINFDRYADDFIITGKSKSILEDAIQPVVKGFLAERGLELSPEKTLITHIQDGFTFLGQTFLDRMAGCRTSRHPRRALMPSWRRWEQ
jgi:RNA-directed DNA polymerase